MGRIKMDCKNIFNTKKDMPYIIPIYYFPEFAVFNILK